MGSTNGACEKVFVPRRGSACGRAPERGGWRHTSLGGFSKIDRVGAIFSGLAPFSGDAVQADCNREHADGAELYAIGQKGDVVAIVLLGN